MLRLAPLLLCLACGGARYQSARLAPAPAPVDRSLFARDPGGQLGEEALQRLLAAPVELVLPARVGVLPIVTAEDWRGPSPDWKRVPAGVAPFARALRGLGPCGTQGASAACPESPFGVVTEMLPIPSGALGMEALREAAARYALRYLLLYREGVRRRERANGWAAGYATLVGMLFLPGQTLEVDGYLEASLFDVKTGLLLFTVRRSVAVTRKSNLFYTGTKLEKMQDQLAVRFAPELAADVRGDVARLR
jgi:hypothetical protein